jgi:hypothetical protein
MMDCKPPTKRLGDATNTGFVCRWNRPEARKQSRRRCPFQANKASASRRISAYKKALG